MICRLRTVTRRVMSWSFVLVSMTVPLHVSAQRVVGIIADQGVGTLPDSARLVAAMALQSWTGPIDEAAIRVASCAQSQMQTELAIGMLRDRHALGDCAPRRSGRRSTDCRAKQ